MTAKRIAFVVQLNKYTLMHNVNISQSAVALCKLLIILEAADQDKDQERN